MQPQPTQFPYDLVVIGGGPAGEKGAVQAAYFGKRVALIEAESQFGGAVGRTGVPGKAMRETALFLNGYRQRALYGLQLSVDKELAVDRLLHRGRQVRQAVHRKVGNNLDRHDIDVYRGFGSLLDEHSVRLVQADEFELVLQAEKILLTPGTQPTRLPALALDHPRIWDSTTILTIEDLPSDLVVVGGGTIGCEYACIFATLGLDVTVVQADDSLLPNIADREIASLLLACMRRLGVRFRLGSVVSGVEAADDGRLDLRLADGQLLEASAVLQATGRRCDFRGLGLDRVGVLLDDRGLIEVDSQYCTAIPNIYAAGDAIGGPGLSSTSMEQARMAMVHAFDLGYKKGVQGLVPMGIWTIPELSMVGAREEELKAEGRAYVAGRARYADNPRGMIVGEEHGMLKLLFDRTTGALLGIHCIGEQACELIAAGTIALGMGATWDTFIDAYFNYPSLSDLYKYATYDALDQVQRDRQAMAGLSSAA